MIREKLNDDMAIGFLVSECFGHRLHRTRHEIIRVSLTYLSSISVDVKISWAQIFAGKIFDGFNFCGVKRPR